MNLVSIIMPVYNGQNFIRESIKSVLNQIYKNWELIIVNDGSNDNSEGIINEFNDNRIRYFRKENGGVSTARNFGIEKARGEYIALLDCDDYMDTNRLNKLAHILKNNKEVDAIYTNVITIDKQNNELYRLKSEVVVENYKDYYPTILSRQIIPAPVTLFFRRKVIDLGIRYPEKYRNSEDYLFSLMIAKKFNIFYLDDYLYYYRKHETNLTNNHRLQVISELEIVKNEPLDDIKKAVSNMSFSEYEKKKLLANILLRRDNLKEALMILNSIEDKDEDIFFTMGSIKYIEKELDEAKKYFFMALRKNKELAEVYNNVGVIERIKSNEANAISNFKKAIDLRPSYMDANINFENKEKIRFTYKKLRKQLTKYI